MIRTLNSSTRKVADVSLSKWGHLASRWLTPHNYAEALSNFMSRSPVGSEEEMMTARQQWMSDNKARFDAQSQED